MDFLVICVALGALVHFGEAVSCKNKPIDLAYMEPEGCWFGPEIFDYNAQFECENNLNSKKGMDPYSVDGQKCVMDCMLKDAGVLKDMKLNRQMFIDQIKKRTQVDFKTWEVSVKNAVDKCFTWADTKLPTINAKDFDNTKKCNPIPKVLFNCVTGEILANGPVGQLDIYCAKLRDFHKTCEYTF